MLSILLKPKHTYDLIRLGQDNDGGYIVEKQSTKKSKNLVSFGLADDWSFEKDFKKFNPSATITVMIIQLTKAIGPYIYGIT